MVVPPRERKTLTGWFAILAHTVAFVLISIGMFTKSWIQAESKAYGTAMDKLGLWWQCFRSFSTNEDIYQDRFFVGCRWIFDRFTTGYDEVREMLAEPFFVSVQVFFTVCFVLAMLGFILSAMLVLCPGEDFELLVFKIAYIDVTASFVTGFIAVTIFGAKAPEEGWMPHPDHNHLSWSYGLATVGIVFEFVSAVLYFVEYRIQQRKHSYNSTHGSMQLQTKA